jgi:hypothetical protein
MVTSLDIQTLGFLLFDLLFRSGRYDSTITVGAWYKFNTRVGPQKLLAWDFTRTDISTSTSDLSVSQVSWLPPGVSNCPLKTPI